MPFQLNEAPNLALRTLSKHKVERGCCCLWSIFCCLPTIGISVGWWDGNIEDKEYIGCGYPQELSNQEKASLRALHDTLQSLLVDKRKVPKESKSELKDNQIIALQVQNTIHVLEKAIELAQIKHGYLEAVQEALDLIKTRFNNEMLYRNSMKETFHITGYG